MRHPRHGSTAAALVLLLSHLAAPTAALGAAPEPVDESRLVPALSPTFVPWTCQTKQSGPVCKGERHIETGWEPLFPCGDTPVWGNYVSDRYQTRYYNHDYLDYYREFRTNDTDYLSTSPTGPATATISVNVRFQSPFDVPGDDQTRTIHTQGVLMGIRSVNGPAVFRAVGSSIEPPGEVGTFTGHVTVEGTTTRYVNAPLDQALSYDDFFEMACAAVLGP